MMTKARTSKPLKKTNKELYELIETKIADKEYIFLNHAKQRLKDRAILDIDVLDILEGKPSRNRKRNKSKDKYDIKYEDWNYCLEGCNLDGVGIRVIVSFDDEYMLIITVIRLYQH